VTRVETRNGELVIAIDKSPDRRKALVGGAGISIAFLN
jgi:hypothetical protein